MISYFDSTVDSQGTREFVRDRERKIDFSLHKGTETLVRHRERFEIDGVRDRESQLYVKNPRAFPNLMEDCLTPYTIIIKISNFRNQ